MRPECLSSLPLRGSTSSPDVRGRSERSWTSIGAADSNPLRVRPCLGITEFPWNWVLSMRSILQVAFSGGGGGGMGRGAGMGRGQGQVVGRVPGWAEVWAWNGDARCWKGPRMGGGVGQAMPPNFQAAGWGRMEVRSSGRLGGVQSCRIRIRINHWSSGMGRCVQVQRLWGVHGCMSQRCHSDEQRTCHCSARPLYRLRGMCRCLPHGCDPTEGLIKHRSTQ